MVVSRFVTGNAFNCSSKKLKDYFNIRHKKYYLTKPALVKAEVYSGGCGLDNWWASALSLLSRHKKNVCSKCLISIFRFIFLKKKKSFIHLKHPHFKDNPQQTDLLLIWSCDFM